MWIQPWLWSCVQIAVVDAGSELAIEWARLGLGWFWSELRQEVKLAAQADFAEAAAPPAEPAEQEPVQTEEPATAPAEASEQP